MTYQLTGDQKLALAAMWEWHLGKMATLTLGGYAGTGKSTLLVLWRRMVHKHSAKKRIAFCAFTGKASQVLTDYLTTHDALYETDSVSTIHRLIYAPLVNSSGVVIGWKKKASLDVDCIVIDEASMITGDLWEDLQSFGVPLMAVGDHGQLPPIGDRFSLMRDADVFLTSIHRQAAGNPIIQLSMQARNQGKIAMGDYGGGVRKLSRYDTETGAEVDEFLQRFSASRSLLLCGYNATRTRLNQSVRKQRMMESETPQHGDQVICLRNNWEVGIYNGMLGVVRSCLPKTLEGRNYFDMEIDIDDMYYSGLAVADQFGLSGTLSFEEHMMYGGDLWDFGYALTVHKAQGSQAEEVLLFEERNSHMSDDDWSRWLYTGVTRAEERLLIVGT